jgi:hypothetical protein
MFSRSFHRKTFKLHILHIMKQERHFEITVSMNMHKMNLVSSVKTAWQYKQNNDDDNDDDDEKSLAYLCLVMVNWLMTLYNTKKQCHLLLLLSTSICNSDWFYSSFPCKLQIDIPTNNALLTLIIQKRHQSLLPWTFCHNFFPIQTYVSQFVKQYHSTVSCEWTRIWNNFCKLVSNK